MTNPQPSRKLRTTPRARWPTKDSGPGFGAPWAAFSALGRVTGLGWTGTMGDCMASSCFTFIAWMPLADFSSLAIWNSTHFPCCRPLRPICGLALTPTKTSPSNRLELSRPQLSLKLLTQPRTVCPTRVCRSSFITTAPTAWYSPDDLVGSSATSNCTESPGPTGPSSGLDLEWMKRSPAKRSEFTKPQWSRKLFILPVICVPTRCGTCARSAGPLLLAAGAADGVVGVVDVGPAPAAIPGAAIPESDSGWTLTASFFPAPLALMSNSTCSPAVRVVRCGLLLRPTKRSPGNASEFTKPHEPVKLRTQPL
mmetsp:Transcript_31275/g.93128  ORF Transcript_31275/g.93128 Transcript_31275/m.93128 type:complete len:310 (+) Transcript_31275:905-1834(+)